MSVVCDNPFDLTSAARFVSAQPALSHAMNAVKAIGANRGSPRVRVLYIQLYDLPKPRLFTGVEILASHCCSSVPEVYMISQSTTKPRDVLEEYDTCFMSCTCSGLTCVFEYQRGTKLLPKVVGQGFRAPSMPVFTQGVRITSQVKPSADQRDAHSYCTLIVPALIAGSRFFWVIVKKRLESWRRTSCHRGSPLIVGASRSHAWLFRFGLAPSQGGQSSRPT